MTTYIGWDTLKAKVNALGWWIAGVKIPGPCALWQCSGDRYIPPGTVRTLDINVFNGTVEQMIARYKLPDVQVPERLRVSTPVPEQPVEQPVTPPETIVSGLLRFKVLRPMNIRSTPQVASWNDVGDLATGHIVTASNVAGGDSWVEIAPGRWAAVRYGGTEYLRRVE